MGVERPDSICFSGIIPGGYLGEGFIFSAIFQAKKEGAGIIEIQDAKALQNDGKGTPANTKIFNFQFPKIFQAPNSMLRKIRIRQKNSSRKSQEMRRSLMENGFLFLPPKIR